MSETLTFEQSKKNKEEQKWERTKAAVRRFFRHNYLFFIVGGIVLWYVFARLAWIVIQCAPLTASCSSDVWLTLWPGATAVVPAAAQLPAMFQDQPLWMVAVMVTALLTALWVSGQIFLSED